MPTNLALDDQLIEDALRLGHHKTKRDAVNAALREYVERQRQLEAIERFGTIDFAPDWDCKASRQRKRNHP